MCGIAGLLLLKEGDVEIPVRSMTRDLAHRGPDGEGILVRGRLGFGHRRLSIIDLEGGRQPMSTEDDQTWITFNGEIYNHASLREELRSHGHEFRSRSDTEVILRAWLQWGERCLDRFRGMFAFAIADFRKGQLFLARDHFGIKPLVYCQTAEAFAFASEPAPLKRTPGFRGDIDVEAIDQYLRFQYIPAPRTGFCEMRKLEPAQWLRVDLDGTVRESRKFWSVEFDPIDGRSDERWVEEVSSVVEDSVRAHMVADVPFGAFLSGGVDSSLVVAKMAGILPGAVETFSIGFQEAEFDETRFAAHVAETMGTIHHRHEVGRMSLGLLPALVRHYGEPFGDSSAIPTWHVCRLARTRVPMVLSGDGADELFAGYGSYESWMESDGSDLDDWLARIEYIPNQQRASLWRPSFEFAFEPASREFDSSWRQSSGLAKLHRAQSMDCRTYLPFDILTKVDIASMMHGLEVRTPFVDREVFEVARRIPTNRSMVKGSDGSWRRKAILKKAAARHFPSWFLDRPKMGFGVPLRPWFFPRGFASGQLTKVLLGGDSLLPEYFEPRAVKGILASRTVGASWLLLVLGEWLRQACERPAPYSNVDLASSIPSARVLAAGAST